MHTEDTIDEAVVGETTTVYFLNEDNEYEGVGNLFNAKVKDTNWYTTQPPPAIKDGEAAVFNHSNKQWEVVVDLRGNVGYNVNGEPFIITDLGDINESLSLKSPALNSNVSSISERIAGT